MVRGRKQDLCIWRQAFMERLIVWVALMAGGIGWWVTPAAVTQHMPVGHLDQMFV